MTKYALCKSEIEGFRKNNCYEVTDSRNYDADNLGREPFCIWQYKLIDGNKIQKWVDAKYFEIVEDIFETENNVSNK